MKRIKNLSLVAVCLAVMGIMATEAYSADIGVVFLHGKSGSANSSAIKSIVEAMRSAGMEVQVPDMPWSRSRGYNVSYEDAMREVHQLVEAMKAKGAKTVFVAGHSLGANGAIGYAAMFGDADGIVAIAPGHTPDVPNFQGIVGSSVKKARDMVAEGHGAEKAEFTDTNQGRVSSVTTTADIYLGYFSPTGSAVIPSNIQKWKKNIPFIWIVGKQDPMYARGDFYAYKKAPVNPANQYVVVDADHMGTPDVVEDEVVVWIQKVASAKLQHKSNK
jgi:pimeloyl-ACP methyl ester carboxylesterase